MSENKVNYLIYLINDCFTSKPPNVGWKETAAWQRCRIPKNNLMARVFSNSMKKVRWNRGKRGSESLLGGLEHLLPVSFVLDVLTPVSDSVTSLQDTHTSRHGRDAHVSWQRVHVYSKCVTSSHLLFDLLLDLLQVGSQVHGHLVFSSQQRLQHGISRHADFLQGGLLHSAQLHHLQLQLSDLKTHTDAHRHGDSKQNIFWQPPKQTKCSVEATLKGQCTILTQSVDRSQGQILHVWKK